jgi:hypothetical protein
MNFGAESPNFSVISSTLPAAAITGTMLVNMGERSSIAKMWTKKEVS